MKDLTNLNGMQDFYFPEGVALPIGGMGTDKHIVLEMHYDNPNLIKKFQGVTHSSHMHRCS